MVYDSLSRRRSDAEKFGCKNANFCPDFPLRPRFAASDVSFRRAR